MNDPEFTKAKIKNILLTNVGFIILLKIKGDDRLLPICVDLAMAMAIKEGIKRIPTPRPLTHDLFKNFLEDVEILITKVSITRLYKGTFYALISYNDSSGNEKVIDARPSDAIALAVRCNVPIFVSRKVFDKSSIYFEETDDEDAANPLAEDLAHFMSAASSVLSNMTGEASQHIDFEDHEVEPLELSPLKKLQHELLEAVTAEKYERAAELRDEITALQQQPS